MAKRSAYFLFKPDVLKGDNVRNAHVFNGHYDTTADEWKYYNESRCGKLETAKSNVPHLIRIDDEKQFCHEVVAGHGSRFNACGICMATFFSDDDK